MTDPDNTDEQRAQDVRIVERSLREDVERELEEARRGLAAERFAREQAERELDEWRARAKENRTEADVRCSQQNELRAERDSEKAARERAEADNAAYIYALRNIVEGHRREVEYTLEMAADMERMGADGSGVRQRQTALDRVGDYLPADAVLDAVHPGTALLERLRSLEAALAGFREYEWERMDWQGICPFRRHQDVRCRGTDGHVSAVGTPTPVPHSEHCPYHALAALKERKP